ncbi:uncharacterized protein [Chironomus tepperi]|uniref:uncharacterized protein isoform X2 n=1 Tax=Chironomus tepperi TaxID=113505 RepID=UPI00391F9B03
MKSIRLTVLCLILHCSLSLSSTIDCKYRDATLIVLGRIYQCAVDNDPNITTQQSAQIDTFNGLHQRNKEDNDVVGFYASHLVAGVRKLEDQALTLSTEELKIKIQKLEKELKTFANFRPISYKLEKLRSLSNKTSAEPEHSTIKSDPMTTKSSENCFQTDQFAVLDAKFSNFSDNFSSEKTKSIKTVDDKLTGIKNTVNNLEIVQNKIVQDLTTAFIGTISLELKTTQESIKLLKNEVTSTVSDTVAAISDVKTNQIDIQATLSKLKTIQNDMKVSMNDLKALVMTNENCRENSENFEEKLANFEAVAVERFDKIENIMFNVGHKMSTNFDEKVKGIEKKMMKKFEELLQENLGKILEEKLEKVMNSRLGIK